MGNKKKNKFTQIVAVAFSFYKCKCEIFLMTANAMCLRIKVAQLNTLRKEITGIDLYLVGLLGTPFDLIRWKMKTQIYVN